MKALVVLVALCMNSLVVTGVFAADEDSGMRRACPKSDFETWDKAQEREACEAKYLAGPEKAHESPGGYIEDTNRRERRNDRIERIERPTTGVDVNGRLR